MKMSKRIVNLIIVVLLIMTVGFTVACDSGRTKSTISSGLSGSGK